MTIKAVMKKKISQLTWSAKNPLVAAKTSRAKLIKEESKAYCVAV